MFTGLDEEILAAIKDLPVTSEMVRDLVDLLKLGPLHVDPLVSALAQKPWWRFQRRDTGKRFIRNILLRANLEGHPLVSDNDGYRFGTWDEVVATAAERCERLAAGHHNRAVLLRRLAARFRGQP
jgi:hypothetical protein